jgi:hypothetical protein
VWASGDLYEPYVGRWSRLVAREFFDWLAVPAGRDWPFLSGQAPAPGYCMSLPERDRLALRDRIKASLPVKADGSIHPIARAWAARGIK